MLKKKIKYEDFDGNPREMTCYFNLNERELAELVEEFGGRDSLQNLFASIKASIKNGGDASRLTSFMRTIIKKSYGQKSGDGIRMVKNDELWDAFYQSEAYNEFFLEVMSSDDANQSFLSQVASKRLRSNIDAAMAKAAEEEAGEDAGVTSKLVLLNPAQ